MIEVAIQAIGFRIEAPTEEELHAGASPEMMFTVLAGLPLPFQQTPGQPVIVPAMAVRFGLHRDPALDAAKQMKDAAERLPKPSDLTIVGNMQAADKIAKETSKFRGK